MPCTITQFRAAPQAPEKSRWGAEVRLGNIDHKKPPLSPVSKLYLFHMSFSDETSASEICKLKDYGSDSLICEVTE